MLQQQQHPSIDKLLQTCLVILERINVHPCEICDKVYCDEDSLMRHIVTHMNCEGTVNDTESTSRNNQKNPESETQLPRISIKDRIRFETDSDDAQADTESSEDNITDDFEPLKIEQDASSSSSSCEVLNMSFLDKTSQGCKENKSKLSSVTSKLTKQRQATVRSGTDNCDQQVSFQTGCKQIQTVKRYTCDLCKKSFAKRQGLVAHEKRHRLEKTYMCEFCERLFMFKTQLKVHKRMHTDERPFSCKVCNNTFRYWSGLDLHTRSYHPNLNNSLEATALPTCAICKTRFGQKANLLRHIYRCHITTGYPCSICRKDFGHPVGRDMHMTLHQGTMKCSVCGKCFQNRYHLNRCELTHKKPYECPNCPAKFGRKDHMENHMRKVCNKGYNRRETPFECTNCSETFLKKKQLTTHIKRFCKPHKCARCKERFAETTTLKIHEKNKICKRKMFECDMCNKSFAKKGYLVRHINNFCRKKKRL